MKENLELYALATIGAVEGVWKYAVQPELTAKRAWIALGATVIAYEMACPRGELLSEGVDRALEKHKALTLGAIAVTAAHLANVLPNAIDPYHWVTQVTRNSVNEALIYS